MGIAHLKHKRIIAFLTVSVFLMVAIFGISYAFGMKMSFDGQMGDCPFVNKATICKMSFAEHITIWQGMLIAIPQKTDIFNLLILVLTLALVALVFRQHDRLLLFGLSTSRQKLYLKRNPHLRLFNYLVEAFSQGILNPKIYETAAR